MNRFPSVETVLTHNPKEESSSQSLTSLASLSSPASSTTSSTTSPQEALESTVPTNRWRHVSGPNDLKDYACGFAAAIVNISVTFPINKVIFRQMLHGHSVRSAVSELRAEGIKALYRGVGPPLIQRSVTLSLMFGTFGTYGYLLETYGQQAIPSGYARFSLAAFLAGSTEALLCPLERIQMLLQDDRKHHLYTNTIDAFKKLRVYGLAEYYRGITAIVLRNGPSNILFFTFRDHFKRLLPAHSHESHMPNSSPKSLPNSASSVSISSSSSSSSSSSYPSSWSSSSSSSPSSSSTSGQSVPIPVIQRILYSELMRDFITGSCVGAIISTVFYPLNVIKTHMQTQRPGSVHISMLQSYRIIREQRDGSVRKLFRGVHVNYSRSFLSWGIINACYELFHRMLEKRREGLR